MKALVQKFGYVLDPVNKIWIKPTYEGIAYSDGDKVETRIASVIQQASDISVLSTELRQHCTDWPSLYHLSGTRANILRPFENVLKGDVLEIGAGCGAITRYLGECGANVLALEGSPRRAAIARSRTRDLENVTVLAEKFDEFQCDHQFDVITLIGVLEYANLFTSGENPARAMLERVRALLKPNGKLIIAIENQLGLKYFAGAPEDHLGQPMYGIEGRYRADQPQTFGRKVLKDMLKQAGFAASEFLTPFPDYKLPVSIITEEGYSNRKFDAAAFAWQSVRRDPQLPPISNFSLELVWPTVFDNQLALDLANSFLVVASPQVQTLVDEGVLAYHYSTDRRPEFCKETVFKRDETGEVCIKYNRLVSIDNGQSNNPHIQFVCPDLDNYSLGKPLSLELIQIVTRDGWSIDGVALFIKRYLSVLGNICHENDPKINFDSPYAELPGEYFDAVPQNIIIGKDGSVSLIDKEWQLACPIEVGHLLFRSLLLLLNSITRFGRPVSQAAMTRYKFIDGVLAAAGLKVQEEDYIRYIKLEANIQGSVTGRAAENYLDWTKDQPIPLLNMNQAMTVRDGQISGLNQSATERDGQIASLNQVLTERDALIGNLGHTVESLVIDRDSQKAGIGLLQGSLEKLAQERDEQVTQLYGVVAEREALIGNLGQTVESLVLDRDSQKAGIGLLQGSLEKLAQERDEQVTQLYGVVAEREALIGNLGQTVESLVLDRDSQKARLEQAQSAFTQLAHVRDEQITRFTQVVAEREQSILSLRTENETLGKELSNVYGSRSWRLTSPMRKLAYFMKRIYGIFFGRLNRYGKLPLTSYEKPESAQNLIDAPLSVNAQLSASDSSNRYRILLVSYYCPTRAHAGGLRILDIYALIRQQRPDVRIDLLTHHRPTIDGSIDDSYQIFDNVYLSQSEDLTLETLVSLRGGAMPHYDLVDLQFHQSAYQLDAFRQVATKVIFTPMESQAKALFLDIATKFKFEKGVGFTRIASLINLAAEEIGFCRKADEVVCVSRTDASFLRAVSGTRRVRGIDTGISKFEFAKALEPDFLPQSAKLKKLKIIYIAYFGSETNVIALKWFLENVHPAIKEKVPGYVLTVVGRGDLSGFERFRGTSVELVGEVPAIAPYISEARVGIAPALGGSGLRGKVNQYAVLGVPCVVSPIALKGLAYCDGKNVCVAETPNDFADGCIRLLTDLELNDRIATAARQLCIDRYSWQSKWTQIRAVYGIKDAA